ncbi:hypothetical protein B0H14DRAFT_2624164 [Mycena olivaceomarginata]|nr:hypothetical protein B0H14DRAFT_2624164 [Mycena olivaceomarginata]
MACVRSREVRRGEWQAASMRGWDGHTEMQKEQERCAIRWRTAGKREGRDACEQPGIVLHVVSKRRAAARGINSRVRAVCGHAACACACVNERSEPKGMASEDACSECEGSDTTNTVESRARSGDKKQTHLRGAAIGKPRWRAF